MNRKSAKTNRHNHKANPAKKPLWEMNTKELRDATAEFDEEFVGETFKQPTAAQKARLAKAKRKRGRPKLGQGVQVISVSVEKNLLKAVDRLAKKKNTKRAELITFGLQAILNGDVPITSH